MQCSGRWHCRPLLFCFFFFSARCRRTGGCGAAMASTAVDVEDLLVRVKNGDDAELAAVAREVAALAEEGRLGDDDDDDGLLVPALLVRLAAAGTAEARVSVMAALRRLACCVSGESKVRLAPARLRSLLSSACAHFVFDAMLP